MTAAEYSESVRQWLVQAYQWQAITYSFPSYLAYQASLQQQNTQATAVTTSSSSGTSGAATQRGTEQNEQTPPGQPLTRAPATTPPHQENEWHEFSIPPLWKRIVAEIIDFFILFILKLVVTYIAVDWFSLIDVDRYKLFSTTANKALLHTFLSLLAVKRMKLKMYDISFLTSATGAASKADLDFQSAVDFTSDFVLLESIHRLVVCIFEALCLHRGFGGRKGGATPGKYIMGLRVVSCFQIAGMAEPGRVQVSPAKDIGFMGATIRAVLKNAAMAFFVPVFFTFIYNRTVYDIMSKSIVIEDPNRRRRRPQQHQHQD